ncbi:TPA: serine hydrolase domain-containing protein [Legionella pneumophila]|nr:beta-lactamase family protein [Legionella sp.]
MPRPTRAEIEERMRKGEIPGVSIAYLDSKKASPVEPVVIGTTDVHSSTPHTPVEQDTIFGAASLSKPVFSYLALKLIADKKLSTTDGKPFDLDTPISEILPIGEFYGKEVSSEFSVDAKKITSRMVLSHTTGIPINGAPRFDFEPGTQYAYGNTALNYLQKAIEKQTRQSFETLAQEEVFRPLRMTHSSFLPPSKEGSAPQPIAANSLHTTASDYARFAAAWMQEKDCSLIKMAVAPTAENQKDSENSRYILTATGFFYYNKSKETVQEIELDEAGAKLAELHRQFSHVTENRSVERLSDKALSQITTITGHTNPLQEAFRPAMRLTEDQWAIDMGVAEKDRQHLAWGLGLGLQLDDTGEVTTAFHSGDMNQWRGWVAMDVKARSAVVYFANGDDAKNGSGHGYGHVLADVIVAPEVELTHGLDWFFKKFGVSRDVNPGWKHKEEDDTARIDTYVRSCLASPPMPLREARELATLDTARERMQQYRSASSEIRPNEPTSTATVEGDKEVEEHKAPSPFQITPKPLGDS